MGAWRSIPPAEIVQSTLVTWQASDLLLLASFLTVWDGHTDGSRGRVARGIHHGYTGNRVLPTILATIPLVGNRISMPAFVRPLQGREVCEIYEPRVALR